MKHIIQNDATKGQLVEVNRNLWIGTIKVKVDGSIIEKIGNKKYRYFDVEGNPVYVVVTGNDFTKVQISVGSYTEEVVRPLKVYEYILACLPLIIVFFGGAIGGALGGLAMFFLLVILRQIKAVILQIVVSIVLSGLVYLIWSIIVTELLSLISPGA